MEVLNKESLDQGVANYSHRPNLALPLSAQSFSWEWFLHF